MSDIVNYVEGLDLFGIKAKQIPCLTGNGAPSAESALKIGLLYINEDNGDMYKCVNGTDGLVWDMMINNSTSSNKPTFMISGAYNNGYVLVHYDDNNKFVTVEEIVDLYFSGQGYFFIDNYKHLPISSFSISTSKYIEVDGVNIPTQLTVLFGISTNYNTDILNSTESDYLNAMAKYLP